jgi:hypothetical protein
MNHWAYALWPDGPWVNSTPPDNPDLSAVVFGSPLDGQFIEVLDSWKILAKKYEPLGISFIAVANAEFGLPYSDSALSYLSQLGHTLPILKDAKSLYSKQWRAYASPTIILVQKSGRVVNFDPGNYDWIQFEKSIQKHLKEAKPTVKLPKGEWSGEVEKKNCPPSKTHYLGNKYFGAWSHPPLDINDNWNQSENWISPSGQENKSILKLKFNSLLYVVAESTGSSSKLDVKNSDGTLNSLTIKGLAAYEIPQKGSAGIDALITNSPQLRIWAIQSLPKCRSQGTVN